LSYRQLVYTALLCLALVFFPFNQAEGSSFPAETISNDSALNALLNGFNLYSSFLTDTYDKQEYQIPRHAANRSDAIRYLATGFEFNLAAAIVDEYTWAMPDLSMAIRPCDGLPVINQEDIPNLTCKQINDNHVVFVRVLSGCYSPDDNYLYQVEMKKYDGLWKISGLSMDKQ